MLRTTSAVASLRIGEGLAAKLLLLVPLGFLIGLGAALWVPGVDLAERAALADRLAFGAVGGLSLLAALVPAAIGLPADVRSGAADSLLAAPLPRLAAVLGGALGYGSLATLLLLGSMGAALLGLEVGGLGAGAREPVRTFAAASAVAPAEDGSLFVSRDSPVGEFSVAVPDSLVGSGSSAVLVRLAPRPRYEGGEMSRTSACYMHVGRRGDAPGPTQRVAFAPGLPLTARLALPKTLPGDELRLTVFRPQDGWSLLFFPGSVEIAGGPELFVPSALMAALCLAPLLFVVAAAAGVGAARFGAPTSLGIALFLLTLFAGQDILRDASEYVLRTADEQAAHELESAGDHEGHDHEDELDPISPLQVALARGATFALDLLPPIDAFDRTSDLLHQRAVPPRRAGRAALLALPAFLVLVLAGWLLLARRELVPR